MTTTRNELRTDLRITGEGVVKRGLKEVGNAAENAGDDLRQMGEDAGFLNRKILELRAAQVALAKQLNMTGDTSLLKDLSKTRRELAKFEKTAGIIGEGAGVALAKNVATGFESLPLGPVLIGSLVAIGVSLLPAIGAALEAAVSGTVGLGGIVGGVVAAAHDPKVKTAAHDLAGTLGAAFKEAGEPFVGPVVESLDVLKREGASAISQLREGFSTLAPELVPLSKGLAGLVSEMMPGLLATFEASRPVLRALSSELPKIGHAIGEFFRITTQDSDAAVLGLLLISRTIQSVLVGTAKLLRGLGMIYEASVKAGEATTGALEKASKWLALLGPAAGVAGDQLSRFFGTQHDDLQGFLDDLDAAKISTGGLGSSTEQLTLVQYGLGVAVQGSTAEIEAQRKAMSDLVDLQLGIVSGNIAVERAFDNLTESVRQNGKSLDINEEAGRRNTEAVLANIEAIKRQAEQIYNTAIAQGATTQEAEAAARAYREKWATALDEATTKLFGYNAELQALIDKLRELDGKRFSYTLVQKGGVTIGAKVEGGIILAGNDDTRASGGPVSAGRSYFVGENGPELFSPGTNGYVSSAAQTAAMMSGASGGSTAANVFTWEPPASSSNAALDQIANLLMPYIVKGFRLNGVPLSNLGAA